MYLYLNYLEIRRNYNMTRYLKTKNMYRIYIIYVGIYVYMKSHNHHNNIITIWVLKINRHSPLHFKMSIPTFRDIGIKVC